MDFRPRSSQWLIQLGGRWPSLRSWALSPWPAKRSSELSHYMKQLNVWRARIEHWPRSALMSLMSAEMSA